jgi:hypothetical protein
LSNTKARRPQRIFLVLVNSIVLNAQNGLRAIIAWSHTGRAVLISEGKACLDGCGCAIADEDGRVKALRDEPYTQKEAEAAIGLRTDNGPRQTATQSARDMEIDMEDSGLLQDSLTT